MSNKILYLTSFVVGGAISTAITFYLSKRHYDKINRIEIDACKDHYDKKIKEMTNSSNSQTNDDSDRNSPVDPADYNPSEDELEDDIIKDTANYMVNLSIEEENKVNKTKNSKKSKVKPYLITEEAYNGDDDTQYHENYKHITLDYYEGDDIVCETTTNEVFGNTGRWLGYVWKNHFGDEDYNYDPDVVYIRNDEIKVDYEIVRDPGYYSEMVLGITPDDKEED